MAFSLGPSVAGFATGLGLIVAIGAQNVFVLRQGLVRRHVAAVVAVCAASDALLIALGTAGLGTLVAARPAALDVARVGGACFLLAYGILAARRALRPGDAPGAVAQATSWGAAVATCLAFTWLNPHVYLDTVLLLGSIAGTHGSVGRWEFAGGAMAASIVWFAGLGYGARFLAPLFARRRAWQALDALVAVVMVVLAVSLLRGL